VIHAIQCKCGYQCYGFRILVSYRNTVAIGKARLCLCPLHGKRLQDVTCKCHSAEQFTFNSAYSLSGSGLMGGEPASVRNPGHVRDSQRFLHLRSSESAWDTEVHNVRAKHRLLTVECARCVVFSERLRHSGNGACKGSTSRGLFRMTGTLKYNTQSSKLASV
jgi:hypothetical protein